MDYQLKQRGRASFDFLRDVRTRAMALQTDIDAFADKQNLPTPSDISDLSTRYDAINHIMQECQSLRALKLLTEWSLLSHGPTAFDAFDKIYDNIKSDLAALDEGPATLTLNPNLKLPAYWNSVDFHGTTGNWDGHDFMGFIHSELIHKELVAKTFPSRIYQDRQRVADLTKDCKAKTILELGCASGAFTLALNNTFPDADIWACDISQRQLEQAKRIANKHGYHWRLFQAMAEDTGLASNQYDLVASYAMFHELPSTVAHNALAEALRVLKPGGMLVMADVKSYAVMEDYDAWTADLWNNVRGYDPFWRDYATTDFRQVAQDLGFVNVSWRGLGDNQYPFVLTAYKPEE